jgi:ABC-2 type transport system permease protein
MLIIFLRSILAIIEVETRKIIRAPAEIFTRSVQPVLWLLIFGQVFAKIHMEAIGGQSYEAFIAPGILAQSVLFIAIFYGIAIIWERDLGVLQKVLISPSPRTAIVLGKSIAAGIRSLSQVIIVYLLAIIIQIKLNFSWQNILGVLLFVFLEAAIFATLSAIIACSVKTREKFMGIGQVITMPLFFASNAIYPIAIMPHWLQVITHWNPLTYEIDALRFLMIPQMATTYGLAFDFMILATILAVLIAIGGWIYPKVIQ